VLVAEDRTGSQVLAWRVSALSEREHYCPECRDPVFVKDGPVKIAHFSHYPNSTCSYGTGEGVRHVELKAAVMRAFEEFDGVRFEVCVIPGRRADVFVPEPRLVVECQASPLNFYEWGARTADYSDAGYWVLWVWDTARVARAYNAEEMRHCHRVCYGQLTACDPETDEWYSVHFNKTNAFGKDVKWRFRKPEFHPIPDEPELITKENEGMRVVNLMRPWWTAERGR
jgi:competence CoiA-like predicted nuclease